MTFPVSLSLSLALALSFALSLSSLPMSRTPTKNKTKKTASLTEWALQLLALLLRHGRPYEELLKERGVDLRASGAAPVFGSVSREVEFSAEKANGYNCFRRYIHADRIVPTSCLPIYMPTQCACKTFSICVLDKHPRAV